MKPTNTTRIAYKMKKANLADPFISPVTGILFGENQLPGLQSGFIWIGDFFNRPAQTEKISISNLPYLGATPSGGKIWRGTADGTPEESDALTIAIDSIGLLATRLVTTNFIIGDALLKPSYPAAQYLSELPDGMLRKTGVKLYQARDGEHYVYRLPESHIWIGDHEDDPVAAPNIEIGNLPDLTRNSLLIGGANNRPVEAERILQDNLPDLPNRHVWVGQLNNFRILTETATPIDSRPVAVQLVPTGTGMAKIQTDGTLAFAAAGVDFAPPSATYIIQQPTTELPHAQALSSLATVAHPFGGLLKSNALGTVAIALPGVVVATHDYVDPASLEDTVTVLNGELEEAVATLNGEIAGVQADLEAQILAVTGYANLGLLAEFLVSIGWTTGYSEYLWSKYKPLLSENKYSDTDNNDYQHGNIWYDASHIGGAGNFKPGIRVTSWDSSLVIDNDLFPISIGLFGYRNKIGYVNQQSGFVWQSYFENDSDSDHYRYPKNFGLYYVTHNKGQIGWDGGERLLMEYKYYDKEFSFEENSVFNKKLKANGGLYLGSFSPSSSDEDLLFLDVCNV